MNSREMLIALAVHHEGDAEAIYKAVNKKEFLDEALAESYLKTVKCNVLTILDAEYPIYLKNIRFPPFVLFYYGDISLIFNELDNLAVVGGRETTEQGRENIYYLVSEICSRYNIVSGLANGIDSVAHIAALENGGKTIAVLANGIEYCYPSCNSSLYEQIKKHNLVISEYYGHISPEAKHFHQRNRLIAAFAKGTLIGEAKKVSGTLITANYTLGLFRTLMVVPTGDIKHSLNDILIKEGAPVVIEPLDILEYLKDEEKSLLCKVK